MSENNASSHGSLIMGLLGLVFITLKLIGIIKWSWWWVLLPFWGPLVLVILIILVIGTGFFLKFRRIMKPRKMRP